MENYVMARKFRNVLAHMSILRRAISLVGFLGILLIGFNLSDSYALSNDSGNKYTNPVTRMESWDYHVKLKNESLFKDLKWRAVGPVFQGGRIESVACPANEPYTMYVGVGAGNLWKTINNGLTWDAIFENESTFSIGCVAVSKSNSDIVWVGTGEAHLSGTSFAGTGVFKSTDAGKNWKNMGLYDSHHIGKVVIDPFDADVVFVAAIGHMSSRNKERGIFKTTDGGKNWKKVLYINDGVRFMDLVMDPADHKTLYAASWDARGGLDSGVFKTTDGGDNWKRLTNGIDQGKHIGRIALDVSISNPNVVYALLVNKDPRPAKKRSRFGSIGGEVYRSDDKGTTWRKVNEKYLETYVGWDFCDIKVASDNEDEIYICGMQLLISGDGGRTYKRASEKIVRLNRHMGENILHLDHHELWIDPVNADRLILGNDGGLYVSYDRGETWLHLNNLPIGEFYTVSVDMAEPYNIYGGTQDNASLYGPGNHTIKDGVADPWRHVFLDKWAGGDGFVTLPDPTDPNVIYYEHQNGDMRRKTMDGPIWSGAGPNEKFIRPKSKKGEPRLRFSWNTPLVISHHNPITLYCGANKVFKSLNRGDDWLCISPDLTPGQRGRISTLSESPLKIGLIYVGMGRGNVQVTLNDGVSWSDVSSGLPNKTIKRVVASRHELQTVYAALSGKGEDEFGAYVYMSNDFGETWQSIVGNLPSESVNVIAEDPRDKDVLYTGTDLGVYATLDRGQTWHSLCNGLPTINVFDLIVHPRDYDLVIGTHGRSIFVLDVENIQSFN